MWPRGTGPGLRAAQNVLDRREARAARDEVVHDLPRILVPDCHHRPGRYRRRDRHPNAARSAPDTRTRVTGPLTFQIGADADPHPPPQRVDRDCTGTRQRCRSARSRRRAQHAHASFREHTSPLTLLVRG